MAAEVVVLFPEAEWIWYCSCGCQQFSVVLLPDNLSIIGIRCADCSTLFPFKDFAKFIDSVREEYASSL